MLSDKAKIILSVLLGRNDKYVTISDLSKIVGLTKRSIYKYLEEVDHYLEIHFVEMIKDHNGCMIRVSKEVQQQLLHVLINDTKSIYTPKGRLDFIKKELLLANTPLTITNLSERLYTSNSQVQRELSQVDEWLAGHSLMLVRKTGTGLYLEGAERDFRNAIVEISRSSHLYPMHGAEKNMLRDPRVSDDKRMMLVYIHGTFHYNNAMMLLNDLEETIDNRLTVQAYELAVEYLTTVITRVDKGHFIGTKKPVQLVGFSQTLESAIRNLSFAISKIYRKDFNVEEIDYLRGIFYSVIYRKMPFQKTEEVQEICENFLYRIFSITKIPYHKDEVLKEALTAYFLSSINRLRNGIYFEMHQKEKTIHLNKNLFNAVVIAVESNPSLKEFEFSNDEYALLTQILSMSGMDKKMEPDTTLDFYVLENEPVEQMLKEKLKQRMPHIHIRMIQDLSQQKNLCVTTGSFESDRMIEISRDITEEDVDAIFRKLTVQDNNSQVAAYIKNLFNKDFIFVNRSFESKTQLLKEISEELRNKNYVTNAYFESVMNREKISATYLGNGIAMPHSVSEEVKIPVISIVTLKESIDWGGGNLVNLVFLMALDFKQAKDARFFFKILTKLINDEFSIDKIKHSTSKEEIIKIVERWYR